VLGQAVHAAGEVRHPFFRADILDPIASAYAEIGRLERALELAQRKDNVSKDRTLLAITQMLVEQGQPKQAGDIASRIEDGYWKASALQKLGRYHISKGEKEAALERFNQALKAAESIGDSFPRVRTMLGIAEAQAAGGDRVKAEETLRQVFVFSSGIQDAESRDLAIGYVAEGQAKLGTWLVPCGLWTVSWMVTKERSCEKYRQRGGAKREYSLRQGTGWINRMDSIMTLPFENCRGPGMPGISMAHWQRQAASVKSGILRRCTRPYCG
jgi:tetratricopeptide (TPR) repeat protein